MQWRLKSPASWFFTQPFVQAQIKANIKSPRHWPLWGKPPVIGEFPAHRASNAEDVSIWWRHQVPASCMIIWFILFIFFLLISTISYIFISIVIILKYLQNNFSLFRLYLSCSQESVASLKSMLSRSLHEDHLEMMLLAHTDKFHLLLAFCCNCYA